MGQTTERGKSRELGSRADAERRLYLRGEDGQCIAGDRRRRISYIGPTGTNEHRQTGTAGDNETRGTAQMPCRPWLVGWRTDGDQRWKHGRGRAGPTSEAVYEAAFRALQQP
jgi:hypothetical protein